MYLFVSEAGADSWRTLPSQLLDLRSFKWVPNHRDHGESYKRMKNSCFSISVVPAFSREWESSPLYGASPTRDLLYQFIRDLVDGSNGLLGYKNKSAKRAYR